MTLQEILPHKILILDGAMGTMIQKKNLTEHDYCDCCNHHTVPQKGNNDMLSITSPEVIKEIHRAYLEAGADIIETNTFNATTVSMADYQMAHRVEEINKASARIACNLRDEYTAKTPQKPRFVVGSIGPTNKSCSISPDIENPALRAIDFDTLAAAYQQQMEVLITEGVDALLIETIFDTLNAKAAIYAATSAMKKVGKEIPIMLSVTLSDSGGRTLSGQTLEAFMAAISHAPILSVGLNCSFGAKDMKPHLQFLAQNAPYYISAYPNAGLPNSLGAYDETPITMAKQIKEYIDEGIVNIIGGCCGTTPAHIATYSDLIKNAPIRTPKARPQYMQLSGLELFELTPQKNFINIGERCNVAGSRKFLRLINEKKYDEAISIAREQVENGAQIIDINMDDALLDTAVEMEHFLNLLSGEPEIAKLPFMIDSSKWEVIVRALKTIQGKAIVNSISLKEGETLFLQKAAWIQQMGAAIVVMAFDEKGQADSYDRKISICKRAYDLLTGKLNFPPQDIIFDPNVLAIATGMEEHRNYALDFIDATRWIKGNLPHAHVSGGISNLSFSLRGNNYLRLAMHSVFLYHAIDAGMEMGIVDANTALAYTEIPDDLVILLEDVILNRRTDATDKLLEAAISLQQKTLSPKENNVDPRATMSIAEKLRDDLIKGNSLHLEEDIAKASTEYKSAIEIIDKPLMQAMEEVGKLFGEGKMFLPQVVKTARTMKIAVELLQPQLEAEKKGNLNTFKGKYLLATVKGDVHDIGKNIVGVVLACNNFEVVDLGVMVSPQEIVQQAIKQKAEIIGLSGLITPSLDEMCHVAEEMERNKLTIPLIIGGATTSPLHTALKIAPLYSGVVVHGKDAAHNPTLASALLDKAQSPALIAKIKKGQEILRLSHQKNKELSLGQARLLSPIIDWSSYSPTLPTTIGEVAEINYSLQELMPLIDWKALYTAWKITPSATEQIQLKADALQLLAEWNEKQIPFACSRSGVWQAKSEEEKIIFTDKKNRTVIMDCGRKRTPNKQNICYSMSDFVNPNGNDIVAAFACTLSQPLKKYLEEIKKSGDDYRSLLAQSLSHRIAEATAQLLHFRLRTTALWGYDKGEKFVASEILKYKFKGIRPAIGYPSLPNHALNLEIDKLLDLQKIGITLTESYAMNPSAAVSGIIIAQPEACYFI